MPNKFKGERPPEVPIEEEKIPEVKMVEYSEINVVDVYGESAQLEKIPEYKKKFEELGREKEIEITGRGPVWLYMIAQEAMHGVSKELVFNDGRGNRVLIYDHHTEKVARPEAVIVPPKIKVENLENKRGQEVKIDIEGIYTQFGDQATFDNLDDYLKEAKKQAGLGSKVTLTGRGPIWLYLAIQHELHGSIQALKYDSPMTGEVEVYDYTKT